MGNHNGCEILSLNGTARFFKKNDNFVILTHTSPDGDTLGSAYALYYALKKMGKKASVICPDVIPKKYSYFISNTDHITRADATIVAVDVADRPLLGSLDDTFSGSVDLNIDHHISNTHYAKRLYLDSFAAATCEMIYEIICALRVEIDDVMAKALYTGIATDTGCFKYSNVTEKTLVIASKLYKWNIDAGDINRKMFDTKSKSLLELEKMVLEGAEYHFNDRCILLTVTAEMQEETGCSGSELDGIATISRSVEGVLAGVTLKQTGEEKYKVSLRTYAPLDASRICNTLGGGGHSAAAGAILRGNLNDVKQQILKAIEAEMEATNAGSSSVE